MASTIGGNVAENAGGPHCLKYGMTHQHVLGLDLVLADGEVVRGGRRTLDAPGLDLVGALVGSEGTFGVVTELVVRLVPLPEAVRTFLAIFDSVEAAGGAVTRDHRARASCRRRSRCSTTCTIARRRAERARSGLPLDARRGAAGRARRAARPCSTARRGACTSSARRHGAREVREAQGRARARALLWKARKGAFGAMGRIANGFYVHGRRRAAHAPARGPARRSTRSCDRHGLRLANVFHAGDGNLHPNVLFDADDPGAVRARSTLGEEILRTCVALGGAITGEHGIGSEKRDLMGLLFAPDDLAQLRRAAAPSTRAGGSTRTRCCPSARAAARSTRGR